MTTIWRKTRGILGTGLLWGALGGVVGIITSIIGAPGDPASLAEWLATVGVGFAGFGFLGGSGFAATLALLDGRKSLKELSAARAAVWGWVAGFTLPLTLVAALSGGALPLGPAIAVAAVFATITAGLGAATVRIAQRRDELEAGEWRVALPESTP